MSVSFGSWKVLEAKRVVICIGLWGLDLYLTEVNGSPRIASFHRPSVYEAHPINVSEWHGKAFVFWGDLMQGNHIPMVELPEDAFDRTEPQRVPTLAAMDGLVGTIPPNEYYIPAPAPNAADTELVGTRMVI